MAIQTNENIRKDNTLTLIRSLRTYGSTARVDLANASQMSSATVTSIISDLLDRHVVLEQATSTARPGHRGRPKTLVELNPVSAFVIGVKLSINEARFTVGDFCGCIQHSETITVNTLSMCIEVLINFLVSEINKLHSLFASSFQYFSGICLAIQGIVSSLQGNIVWSPAFSFRNVNITAPLAKYFSCPIHLENDANCIAATIANHQDYIDIPNIVVIMLGYGVGMSVLIDGKPYLGAHGSSAEFGHTKYEPLGALCACGRRGCIESYISDYALYREAHTLLSLPSGDSAHPSELQMQALTRLARDGNAIAVQIFNKAGYVLGTGIANVMALFNPNLVCITGSGIRAYDVLKPALERAIQESLVEDLIGQTRLVTYSWDHDMTCIGAINIALNAADLEIISCSD